MNRYIESVVGNNADAVFACVFEPQGQALVQVRLARCDIKGEGR